MGRTMAARVHVRKLLQIKGLQNSLYGRLSRRWYFCAASDDCFPAADLYACTSKAQIKPEAFHRIVGGSQVDLYTLKNSNRLEAKITNYGGIVVSLLVPDKNGKLTDVVLGHDDLCDYLANTPYFGCIVGRSGNRIANGKFTLGGVEYHLVANNGPNSLHGGRLGHV
jgi:aldose 1-epimerase